MYSPSSPVLSPAILLAAPRGEEPPFPFAAPVERRTYFYMARNAIFHLLRALRLEPRETVLVPDYHHGVEVEALRAAGASLRVYPIDRHLQPDLDAVARLFRTGGARVLYAIHYLGWPQPLEELGELCRRHGALLIEDCALALLSAPDGHPLGSTGEFAVYCLYKTLPVPNGGLLLQNRSPLAEASPPLSQCGPLSLAARCAELGGDWVRCHSERLGAGLASLKRRAGQAMTSLGIRRWAVGDSKFKPGELQLGMSALSAHLLRRFDFSQVVARRRANFRRLAERLEGSATPLFATLPDGVCPLFFPILVPDKHAAAQALLARGIGAVEFWNRGAIDACDEGRDARFLRRHLLELPIHQDIGAAQLEAIADAVGRLGLRLGAGRE